jgi:hypothetical protein
VAMLGALALAGQAHASEPLQPRAVELSPLDAHVTTLSGNTDNIRFLASEKAHERGLYGKGISNPDDLK